MAEDNFLSNAKDPNDQIDIYGDPDVHIKKISSDDPMAFRVQIEDTILIIV